MSVDPSFRSRVLSVVRRIPTGQVATYGDVAAVAGHPRASRAVGNIMRECGGKDIPAIASSRRRRRLGGYGGNLELKRSLLRAEGVLVSGIRIRDFKARRWSPRQCRRGPGREPGARAVVEPCNGRRQRHPRMTPSKVAVHPRPCGRGAASPRRRDGARRALPQRRSCGVRGGLPRPRRPAVQRDVPDARESDGCRGSPSGNLPRRAPEAGFVPRRLGVRDVAVSAGNEPVPRLLAEPRGSDESARPIALDDEPGLADAGSRGFAEQTVSQDGSRTRAHEACRRGVAPRSCCTTSKGWSTGKSARYSASRRARRSRRFTRHGCGFARSASSVADGS